MSEELKLCIHVGPCFNCDGNDKNCNYYQLERTCTMARDEVSKDEMYPTYWFYCSECELSAQGYGFDYCPNCGARVVDVKEWTINEA